MPSGGSCEEMQVASYSCVNLNYFQEMKEVMRTDVVIRRGTHFMDAHTFVSKGLLLVSNAEQKSPKACVYFRFFVLFHGIMWPCLILKLVSRHISVNRLFYCLSAQPNC